MVVIQVSKQTVIPLLSDCFSLAWPRLHEAYVQ